MKKISLLLLLSLLVVTGCSKNSEQNVLKNMSKDINNSKGYILTGKLEVVNNDDTYNYQVTSAYKKGDYYRISLKNTANDHEQIILKNDEGVYVLTPSLKKSFKFQSDWPYNNSQVYLLQSIIQDIENDNKATMEKDKNNYIFTSTVNYPNNRNLIKQKVTVDNKLTVKKVEVLNDNDIPKITLNVKSIDKSPKFGKNYFEIEDIMSTFEDTDTKDTKQTSSIEDIIYPLVVPEGTKLKSEEKLTKTGGERVILTFEGEKPFLLVEETAKQEDELTIIPTIGEPYMFMDTIGALSDNSLTWSSGNMEYYLVSDVMNQEELVEIASSINVLPTMK
ncbi:MAG: hypothetical protein PUB03_05180 [bacterium]|nr:hypothetical protein [bacterium]